MASILRQIFANLSERVDEDLLPSLYQAASLSTEQVRRELVKDGLRWHDPESGYLPDAAELDAAAEAVIQRAVRSALVRGAVGGAGGALAIPPEVAASLVQTLRLAQRLGVLFGFDPQSSRGRLMLSRALEAAFELELPDQRALGVRISDLPQVARQQLPDIQRTTAWIARTISWQVARRVGGRLSRLLPGFGAGVGAWDAQRVLRQQGERMKLVYTRAWDGDLLTTDDNVIEAEEIVEL
ncbi:MAG: hypothetical protein ACI8S6_005136 [Myxococcota bacterium]|jgi:hypothetical protein